jgi:Protein of unknown function (DUF2948)
MVDRLKLRAEDEEDLRTISAILQDALVLVSEMTFIPEERRFVLVANRFRWEAEPDANPALTPADAGENAATGPTFERVLTGICFEGIAAVRLKNIDRHRRSRILELLQIGWTPEGILLMFAGDSAILLEARSIACRLDDICEPWPTPFRPRHEVDPEAPKSTEGG